MDLEKHHIVLAKNYSSDYTFYDNGSFSFKRVHQWKTPSIELDVFPYYWSVAVSDLRPGQLKIRAGSQLMELSGLWAAFIPAFSIVEWQMQPGEFRFEAFLSQEPLPAQAPSRPCLFPLDDTRPNSIHDLMDLLSQVKDIRPFGKCLSPPPQALSTKSFLDTHFQVDISISEIANQLDISHAAMTRNFKKSFGMSPIAYRNKLRVYHSVADMLTRSEKVYRAGLSSGFSDISRFYSQFRKYIGATPSLFLRNDD